MFYKAFGAGEHACICSTGSHVLTSSGIECTSRKIVTNPHILFQAELAASVGLDEVPIVAFFAERVEIRASSINSVSISTRVAQMRLQVGSAIKREF
jgi:hypothetical protein